MKFHERLRELKGDMSEAALSKASGLPYATIHNYILGRRRPLFGAVVKLAAALGTTCEAFSGCDDLDEAPVPTRRLIAGIQVAESAPASPKRGRPPKAPAIEATPVKNVRKPRKKE